MCANSFNVLFRAAGIGGRVETHAFLTPTSRGLRAALKQEDIEFTMPLKKPSASDQPNKSLDSGIENTQSTSFTNLSDEAIQDPGNETTNGDEDDEDEDQEQWLASLGVEAAEIRKISSVQDRKVRNAECEEDFSDHSVVLIEGVECQAFFNFLLNSKSTTAKSGRLAGVPPTLYSPVAFPGATLRNLHTRATQIHLDNQDYQSMELRGVILPHVLQNLCCLLRDTKDTFSASMSSQPGTISFCKASQRLIEGKSLYFIKLLITNSFEFQTQTRRITINLLAIMYLDVKISRTVGCPQIFWRLYVVSQTIAFVIWNECVIIRNLEATLGPKLEVN